MDIEYIKSQIEDLIETYWVTAIGDNVYNWHCNTRDDDYEGIEEICNDLYEQGCVG